jgi:hypothetical protein
MTSPSKRRLIPAASLLLATFAAAFVYNGAKILIVDSPQPSDVIVVLAGETEARPAHALKLLREGYASRMLIDVPASANIYGTRELDLARKYIDALPDHSAIDICPIKGLSTRDESHDVEQCLSREQGQRILVVTSDFHTRRSLSIFRHEIRGKTFSVAAARDATQFGENWWTHRQWAKTCVDEWLRLFWWQAIERWR